MQVFIEKVLKKSLAWLEQKDYKNTLSREDLAKINPSSLLFYYGNIHSQVGQDGILAEIFRRLHIKKGTFVEFGAWDGKYLSNSRLLFEKGWKGVYIEANPKKYTHLKSNYRNYPDIKVVNAFVGAPQHGVSGKNLGSILKEENINPEGVTFVSIDVDGSDLEIFEEIGFKPPVIVMEGGFNFAPSLNVKISDSIARYLQWPISIIFERVMKNGYTPVCFFQDTYLVRNDLIGAFPYIPKNAVSLYSEAFWFMPSDHQQVLIKLREKNSDIKTIESSHYGKFYSNPMEYEQRKSK